MNTQFKQVLSIIKSGDVIAAPTDTVYGLLGDATSDIAVQRVYELKKRPINKQLIVLVSGLDMAKNIAEISHDTGKIAEHFWIKKQQPLTLILNLKTPNNLSKLITSGYQTIALRRPSNSIALDIIEQLNLPLFAPSANISSHISPTSASMVHNEFGNKIKLILDTNVRNYGVESTILDITKKPYTVLRTGSVSNNEILDFIKKLHGSDDVLIFKKERKNCCLKLPLRKNVESPYVNEAFIAFGQTNIKCDVNLSPTGDVEEAAKNLYCAINALDDPTKYSGIAVMPIPNTGIGLCINDKLDLFIKNNKI